MNGAQAHSTADSTLAAAASRENAVVGEEIVRHRFSVRLVHWLVALAFFATLLSGLPIWSPVFGWMAGIFGGLAVCRWLHPWSGVAFVAFTALLFLRWVRDMVFERSEWGWLGPKMWAYLKHQSDDSDVGKFNGGQKLLFWTVAWGAIGMLATGIVMWFPEKFPQTVREIAILLHDVTFLIFAIAIVVHIYLGTAAVPGTFGSMTHGVVSKSWARRHHPRWYREVVKSDADGPKSA